MSMEEDLRDLVMSLPLPAPKRVSWAKRPQGSELPAVVLHRISYTPTYHMEGPTSVSESRVQVDVWGLSYDTVKNIARPVIKGLSGYAGRAGETEFQLIMVDGERDQYDAGTNDAERIFGVSFDLLIHHKELVS